MPSFGTCNRRKQRAEDGPAVFFQFGHEGEVSRRVLMERVPWTLAKNRRLHTSLRQGLQEELVRLPSGIVVPGLGIKLDSRERSDSYTWFQFVTRGLYCFEFSAPLSADHSIHLIRPIDGRFDEFTELIIRDPNHKNVHLLGENFNTSSSLTKSKRCRCGSMSLKRSTSLPSVSLRPVLGI